MADAFGNPISTTHSGPVLPTGEGSAGGVRPPVHAATVVSVDGAGDGVVHHQVRLLGRVVPLDAPAEIPVGTVLEVLAFRSGGELRAVLPGTYTGALAVEFSGARAGSATPGESAAPAGSPLREGTGTSARPAVEELPVEVVARLRREGVETDAGVRAARRLLGLGLPTDGASLRGGARVEADPSATVPRLARSLAAALAPLADDPGLRSLLPALRELPATVRALADPTVRPAELEALVGRLTRLIVRAVDAALTRDPRVAAARTALAELGAPPAPGAGPDPRPPLVRAADALSLATPLAEEGLSVGARRRGIELLRGMEHRAIEEHPVTREFGRALREVIDRSHALTYRLAVDAAERDAGFRPDPDSTWFVATPQGRPVRVRRSIRRPHDEKESAGAEQRFRIETRGWGLGEIVVDGTQRVRGAETVVGIEFSAEEERTRAALAAEVATLLAAFEGTGLTVSAHVVPWSRGRDGAARGATPAPSRADGLDRRA